MSIFGFLARKASPAEKPNQPAASNNNPLELDEELFSVLGAQLGGENEALRNLLFDANNKINELDVIKAAVGKLVDPVSKALREFEAEKTEKAGLQSVLNNTRIAYGKLRNEVSELEKKFAAADREAWALRNDLATAQDHIRTLEASKSEINVEIVSRRAQAADLESRIAQFTGECNALREENRRFDERVVNADKKVIALESDLTAARQRLLLTDDEKRAQQLLLDKASSETARLSRKLAETEASFNALQGRLRHVEVNFTEAATERVRLATALDEANERAERDRSSAPMRFDALQGAPTRWRKSSATPASSSFPAPNRSASTTANMPLTTERDDLQARLSDVQAQLFARDSQLKEVDDARSIYVERNASLARAFTAKEAALAQAAELNASLNERIGELEALRAAEHQVSAQRVEELESVLSREKLERSVIEGALATARKDFAKAMRELMTLQHAASSADNPTPPRPANAA
jgi:chromosome segregation ATPase